MTSLPSAPAIPSLLLAVRRGRVEREFVCPPTALFAAPPRVPGTLGARGIRPDYLLTLRAPFLSERVRRLP